MGRFTQYFLWAFLTGATSRGWENGMIGNIVMVMDWIIPSFVTFRTSSMKNKNQIIENEKNGQNLR